jgi:hypothetical protein
LDRFVSIDNNNGWQIYRHHVSLVDHPTPGP